MPHDPAKPAARSKVDNDEFVRRHLASLPLYERGDIFSRVLQIVDDANKCDDAVRDLCVSK
jgi:hypothetical protein